jgi:hypothetical protein
MDKYLDSDSACAYETRIPDGYSSRDMAFLPFLFGILFCGVGVFMADDAALGKVGFWSNPVVLLGIGLALSCNIIGASMLFRRWRWTATQMGINGLFVLTFFYLLSGASLSGILFYGSSPFDVKVLVFFLSLAWNGYWIHLTIRGCRAIWADESLRQRVWVDYKDAVVYRRSAAKAAMDKVGLKPHPGNLTMVFVFFLMIPFIWWRAELSAYFGVPFVHVFVAIIGQSVAVMGWIFPVLSFMLMIYYPQKIKRSTGKAVLFDMMAPANAPIPSQNR